MRKISLSALLVLGSTLVAHAEPSSPASTQLIRLHGHNTAFHVTPGNKTTVVLDAGGGLDSTYWDSFVPELSRRTGATIITYDRAGFGRSDEVPGPWSLDSATRDLANGLKQLGKTRNVILVSHSIAGEIATSLVCRYPRWFKGVVLVDANVPDVYTEEFISRAVAMYAPVIAATRAAPLTPQGRQLLAVSDSFVETSRAFHGLVWPASVAATVIVAEHPPFESEIDVRWWKDAHAQFARGANNRRLVVADRSSHDVVHDRPDVIMDAIIDISQRAGGN